MTEQLVPAYHRARFQAVVTAGVIYLSLYSSLQLDRVPVLDVPLPSAVRPSLVLGPVLLYALIRLVIEWAQSHPERRRRIASRIDFGLTLLITLPAAAIAGREVFREVSLPSLTFPHLSWLSAAALIVLGIFLGEVLSIWVLNLFLIRPKDEARRLALPRVPVAVRASFRFAYILFPAVLIVTALSPSFDEPLSQLWYWLIGAPATLLFTSGLLPMLSPTRVRPDGTVVSRAEFIRSLRRAFNRHDAHYQIGGWDKPVPPHNTPLYQAAEAGDLEAVRRHLDGGARPDEFNSHGWTALMIAAAQQHLRVALLLLDRGANPNICNLLGRNAMMFAARYGNQELVRSLLNHGADPNLNESNDPSALSSAAWHGHMDVVRLLLDAGADPSVSDDSGRTPLEYAEQSSHGEIAGIIRRARRDGEGAGR